MMLYKYRSLSTHADPKNPDGKRPKDYTLDLLKHNEFYFSSPDQFNDPFDCYIPKITIKGEKTFKQLAHRCPKKANDILLLGHYYNYNSETIPKKNTPLRFKQALKYHKDEYSKYEYRVFSLTEKKNNILMWAHYANSFSGICLGFDFNEIESNFKTKPLPCELADKVIFDKIKYNPLSKLPDKEIALSDLYFHPDTFVENLILFLTTKHKQWEYENEYRLISYSDSSLNNNKLKFQKSMLKKIIFGLNCTPEDKKEIKEIVKHKYKQAKFYKCVKKTDEYGVDIVLDEE